MAGGNDERVNLLISALVDGLENVAALSGELKELEKSGKEQVEDNTKDLREGADETKGVMEGLRANIGKVVAAGAALGGIAATLKSVSSEAAAYETRMKKLEAVVNATGGAAGYTAEEIRSLSQELALATLGSVEEFEDASAALLTFKSISGEAFGQALELSKDLAEVMGGDAGSAARQLGRALEDPAQGLNMLRRSGVSFTDAQRDVINSLMETGEVAEAQKIILEQVAAQVGGVARSMADGTLDGALDTLGQRFEELKVKSGEAINPALVQLTNQLTGVLESLAANIEEIKQGAEIVGSVALTAFAVKMAGAVATANVSLTAMSARLLAMPAQINAAAASMSRLQKSVALVGSAFVGWQVGTYLKDEFVEIERAGIALAGGLTKMAERARFAFEVLNTPVDSNTLENISAAYDRMQEKLIEIDNTYADMFANAGKAAESQKKLGKEGEDAGEKLKKGGDKGAGGLSDLEKEAQKAKLSVIALNKDLGKLGLDPEKYRSGLSTIESETISTFQKIVSSTQASGKQIADSFTQSLSRVSVDAIPQLTTSLKQAMDDGRISVEQFQKASEEAADTFQTKFSEAIEAANTKEGLAELREKIEGLKDAGEIGAAGANKALETIRKKALALDGITIDVGLKDIAKDAEEAGDAIDDVADKAKKAKEEAAKARDEFRAAWGDAFGAALTAARTGVTQLSAAARNMFETKIKSNAFVEETVNLREQLEKTTEQVQKLAKAQRATMSTKLSGWFTDIALAAAEVKKEYYEQAIALESLTQKMNAGQLSMQDLDYWAARADSKFNLLDKQTLSGLQGAIDQARSKIESLESSAESTLNSLSQRLAEIQGDTERAQQLQYEAEKKRLIELQKQAAQEGADNAAADYGKALQQLEKINAIEQKSRREAENEREKEAADRQARQEQAERERQQFERQRSQTTTSSQARTETVKTVNVNLGGRMVRVIAGDEDNLIRALENARSTAL
ncbi:hypothetical protein GCM10011533_30410 [Streptosporangium jomthongense]|uniref:Phage tail length tape measure family protein n=1 Tax=Marinobacter aromaticivorans TaxID=1494078 RepID=A0ABW2IXW8_9GAMM|nr:phage tail length tape measure family protein [Marinobacter aromaticivorans]GGE75940.1 hypothetical protein GCM10011533_30410 [Streptosporangium jomthongense]